MAKGKTSNGNGKGDPVAIFLVKFTAKTQKISPFAIKKDQDRVTKAVANVGGTCELYKTPGGVYDFVSVVKGVPAVTDTAQIAEAIEAGGLATATLMSGFKIFK